VLLLLPPAGALTKNVTVFERGYVLDGRYEILEHSASGGMGRIYRARRTLLGDEVAIKVIDMECSSPRVVRRRFLRESQTCALLRHPNIVTILDFNLGPDGYPYLAMEWLNGASLRDELAGQAFFSPSRVQEIIQPICAALQVAHDRRIVHRDLKPGNIVSHRFDSGEVVYKVIDFGLANALSAVEDTRLTQANTFVGTLAYAAPEQFQNEPLDSRADIYSLGAVVFTMLTGRPPFDCETPLAALNAHLSVKPPKPSSLRAEIPSWMDDVVLKALAKRPDDRWQTMNEFGHALQESVGTRLVPSGPRPSTTLRSRYEIGPVIATGRLGSRVYSGTHRALGSRVAIRVLRRADVTNWEAVRARFLTEARSLQAVHPSILLVRDFGEDDDCLYLVTDYIHGVSLRELLSAEGKLPFPRLRRLALQLLDAAQALHRRGGLLCGLSPDIIRMSQDEEGERLVISSGGISQVQDLLSTLSEQTLRGGEAVEAELHYVAPELLMGKPAEISSDIFTIGVLTYEMATGELPFAGHTLPGMIGTMLGARPRDPRELAPSLPAPVVAAILKCLEREPADRHAHVSEIHDAWSGHGDGNSPGEPALT
jgi:serine/threonine protein kinase